MRCVKVCLISICMALLAGCQGTPDRVKENMEKYGKNPQVERPELNYCSIKELQGASLSDDGYGNLNLPDSVDFSHVGGAGILHITLEEDFLRDEIVEKYASLFQLEKEKFADDGESWFGKHLLYKENGRYMSMAQNGGIAYMAGQSYDFNPGAVEERYSVDRDDISGVIVDFPSGNVALPYDWR